MKVAPAPGWALGVDRAAVARDHLAEQGQAQAEAAVAGARAAVEAVEDALGVGRVEAVPGVGDHQLGVPPPGSRRVTSMRPPGRGVGERVGEQFADHAAQRRLDARARGSGAVRAP